MIEVKGSLFLTNIASLAMAEVRLILARIIRRYDLECMMQDSWLDQPTYLLWERKPLLVKMTLVNDQDLEGNQMRK